MTPQTTDRPPGIITDLDNDLYHNGELYRPYLSSTQLKYFLTSPRYYRYMLDHPQPQTEAQRFGSLFHNCMEWCSRVDEADRCKQVDTWAHCNLAVFEPPVNAKTGKPYGITTNAYNDALKEFTDKMALYHIVTQSDRDALTGMAKAALTECGSTSEMLRKLLRWGRAEVSHFLEYEGCLFKFRPDLESKKKMVDYKTVATDDLSERSVNNIISRYGYDISASFYLFMEHEQSGIWKEFYWLFVTKNPPYDAVLVNSSKWTVEYDPDTDTVRPQAGMIKMRSLLDMYIRCHKTQEWPGAEIFIPKDDYGRRIMTPQPPPWEISMAADLLANQY